MRKIVITENSEGFKVSEESRQEWHEIDGINIDFILEKKNIPKRENLNKVSIISKSLPWVSQEGTNYNFNLEKIKEQFIVFSDCKWMKGTVLLKPEIEEAVSDTKIVVCFSITKEEVLETSPKKVFLSHKGANKPLVREYFHLLKEIGFEPWLDEDAMVAGANLNRAILEGFQDSCAAVFFITPEFVDEDYLADEVDYAIDEKRAKKEKFSIITLALKQNEEQCDIPKLLKKYVYKEPQSQLESFREIIRALPINSGNKQWK